MKLPRINGGGSIILRNENMSNVFAEANMDGAVGKRCGKCINAPSRIEERKSRK